jgi:hypothetical protein
MFSSYSFVASDLFLIWMDIGIQRQQLHWWVVVGHGEVEREEMRSSPRGGDHGRAFAGATATPCFLLLVPKGA